MSPNSWPLSAFCSDKKECEELHTPSPDSCLLHSFLPAERSPSTMAMAVSSPTVSQDKFFIRLASGQGFGQSKKKATDLTPSMKSPDNWLLHIYPSQACPFCQTEMHLNFRFNVRGPVYAVLLADNWFRRSIPECQLMNWYTCGRCLGACSRTEWFSTFLLLNWFKDGAVKWVTPTDGTKLRGTENAVMAEIRIEWH